ncbi:MAG: hypothetical protein CME06_12530 [Gemmatimonadetes bacterium]|nr:hypothetical protein [Gemmatimonadota bacterium]
MTISITLTTAIALASPGPGAQPTRASAPPTPRQAIVQLQPADRAIDLQAKLDAKIAKNRGYGGGLFRMSSGSDGVLFEGVSGDIDRIGGVPIEPRDTFEIASTSKTFTAATILLLKEEGLLFLDDPISTYLPTDITQGLLVIDDHDYGPEITLRQCLNHTSGLPDYWYDPPYVFWELNAFLIEYYRDWDMFWEPEDLIGYAKDLTPIAPPGTLFHYSDTGYVLLGMIAEIVANRQLHHVYRDLIFSPFAMNDTYLPYREQPTSPHAESHRYEWKLDMYGQMRQSADWAGGGLVSSTRDLETFSRALFQGELFDDPATLEEMREWVFTGDVDVYYGLGIYQIRFDGGIGELVGHDGYGNAWMYYWPEEDVSFTGTLNQALNDWWSLVVWGMVSVIVGD